MPAPHYALSEALIVISALWASWRMGKAGLWFGAGGVVIFGAAAAIGVYRFGTNEIETFAVLHRNVSQIGGATAVALVAIQCAMVPDKLWNGSKLLLAAFAAAGTLAISLFALSLTTPLFIAWLLTAIGAALRWPEASTRQKPIHAAIVAIMLVNVLLIRRSAMLGPDLSWHLFHVLVAIWIAGLCWVIFRNLRGQEA